MQFTGGSRATAFFHLEKERKLGCTQVVCTDFPVSSFRPQFPSILCSLPRICVSSALLSGISGSCLLWVARVLALAGVGHYSLIVEVCGALLPIGDAALTSKFEEQVQDQERQQPEAACPPLDAVDVSMFASLTAPGPPEILIAGAPASLPLREACLSSSWSFPMPRPHTGTVWEMNHSLRS